jgi:hypothetical protein
LTEPTAQAIAAEVVEILDPRIERMERAILGEESIGHVGLVERLRQGEAGLLNLAQERLEGDRRLHERIDHIHNGKASTEDVARLAGEVQKMARKFDRITWIVAGVGIGSGGLGAWLTSLASS